MSYRFVGRSSAGGGGDRSFFFFDTRLGMKLTDNQTPLQLRGNMER